MEYTADLADLAATKNFALAVANQLQAGDVIILTGELGAGKTTFTQGLARGLGITAPITSPPLVLARHRVNPADGLYLVHVDAYRMSGEDELACLELERALEDSVIVVEWGRGTPEALTDLHLDIELQRPGAVTDELI